MLGLLAKLLIVDPIGRSVVHATLQVNGAYTLRAQGRTITLGSGELDDLLSSCIPLPSRFGALVGREQRICIGKLEDEKYIPLIGGNTAVYIVVDLDLTHSVIVNIKEKLGVDNEVLVTESSRINVKRAWMSWEAIQKVYEYTIVMVSTLPPARIVLAGLREVRDRATGRTYIDVLDGLRRDTLRNVLEGVKALELASHMPLEQRSELIKTLALPASLYRELYIETRQVLEEVIGKARELGYELIASYAEAKLEQLVGIRSLAERLGFAVEAMAPVKVKRGEEGA